jgi:hypothetical protein
MKKLYFLFTFGLIISYCKKEENAPSLPHTIAEGYVIHSGTKIPLDIVRVSIWNGMPCSDPLGCDESKKEEHYYNTTYTNSEGFFHIEIDGREPVMFLYKKDYSFEFNIQGAVIGIIPLNEGENKNLRFEMDAKAFFKPSAIYCRDCSLNDTTWYGAGNTVNPPIHPAADGFYLGKGPNEINYSKGDNGWPSKGDKFNYYWFYYQINGIWRGKVDSVYIKSFTTYTDTIYY